MRDEVENKRRQGRHRDVGLTNFRSGEENFDRLTCFNLLQSKGLFDKLEKPDI